jgi:MOSC domain-containing protein YiiM
LHYIEKEKGPKFLKTLKGRRGWYAKVLKEGKVKIGDSIEELI